MCRVQTCMEALEKRTPAGPREPWDPVPGFLIIPPLGFLGAPLSGLERYPNEAREGAYQVMMGSP